MLVKSYAPGRESSLMEPLSDWRLHDVFDRFFDNWMDRPHPHVRTREGHFIPRVDVLDDDGEIRVTVELPGVEEKDVEVDLTSDYLSIKGRKREVSEETHTGYYRSERIFGEFRRDITLPCEVQIDEVKADFHAGILTVKLPKSKEVVAKVRKIPVHGGG